MAIELCGHDVLMINGKEIPVKICYISQSDLCFFPQNPRIYSSVCRGDQDPAQDEIEKELSSMEHVKQLKLSIEANGGLLEALIVRDGDMVVLEGNSRLAAYRILAKSDPIKWGRVKCNVLSSNIAEDLVFALLGQIHIVGRKDWAPFEQAGYLWRRHKEYKVSVQDMAEELGLSVRRTNQLIEIYSFMATKNDVDPQHWSYYEEYFKSRKIQNIREDFPNIDQVVVEKIAKGEIPQAIDIRHKVEKIAAAKGKALKHFLESKRTLDECVEIAQSKGVDNTIFNRLFSCRQFLGDPDLNSQLKEMGDESPEQQSKCVYELRKINKATAKILQQLGVSS